MHYTSTLDINLEQIQFFLAVARQKNFTKAAEMLYISQSLLSRKISMLEKEVGVQLFYRRKNGVELTLAGDCLFREWSDLIERVEKDLEGVRMLEREMRNRVNIGFIEYLYPINDYLFPFIRKAQENMGDIEANIESFDSDFLMQRLDSGAIDIALIGSMDILPPSSSLNWERLGTFPMCVGMSRVNHPLAKQPVITWDMLRNENFLTLGPTASEECYSTLMNACSNHGFTPKVKTYRNKASIILNLELGNGIHIGSFHGFSKEDPRIKIYEIDGAASHILIAWKPNQGKPVEDFVWHLLKASRGG